MDPMTTADGPNTTAPCRECAGIVDPEGWCESCGALAPPWREYYAEESGGWVAGVCDRGLKHERNEDALALWASAPPLEQPPRAAPGQDVDATISPAGGAPGPDPQRRAVLVVCDGVSSSPNPHLASLAAARASREVLVQAAYEHRDSSAELFTEAARAANQAVLDSVLEPDAGGDDDPTAELPGSCTITMVTVHGAEVAVAGLGDSRAYWIADDSLEPTSQPSAEPTKQTPAEPTRQPSAEPTRQLSVDDSVAQLQMAMGVDRQTAESGPQAHAITRWLGPDAPDLTPEMGGLRLEGAGWLLVCSDGLWNYASSPEEIQTQLRAAEAAVGTADPGRVAGRLMQWACEQGGRDNITVALARLERLGDPEPTPGTDQADRPAAV